MSTTTTTALGIAFGTWLKKTREDRGLSLRDVARATGVHFTSIRYAELEFGEPKLGTFIAVAQALGANPTTLMRNLLKEANS